MRRRFLGRAMRGVPFRRTYHYEHMLNIGKTEFRSKVYFFGRKGRNNGGKTPFSRHAGACQVPETKRCAASALFDEMLFHILIAFAEEPSEEQERTEQHQVRENSDRHIHMNLPRFHRLIEE